MVSIKYEKEIEYMRASGKIMIEIFDLLENKIKPGVTTKDLDKIVHEFILTKGAKPSFYKYNGFPASICTSVDDVIIHGIPSESEVLQEGQIIGVDIGVIVHGYHTDAARTYAVGKISPEKQKLIDITEQSFYEGIKNLKAGSRIGDIGSAIQKFVEKHGFTVVREFVGHGVGRELHEDPCIPNYGFMGSGIKLQSGMTLAIEPMVNMGTKDISVSGAWSVKTKDGKPSAHYENTIVIWDDGVEILTNKGGSTCQKTT